MGIPRTSRVAASLAHDGDPRPDLRLADLALSAESGRVAVAFRTEGVVIREPDGTWVQEPVGPVVPLASSPAPSVTLALIRQLKWSGLAVFWLSLGALAPAAWLGAGRRQVKASTRRAYAGVYLAAAAIILGAAKRLAGGASGTPPLVREALSILVVFACVLVAVSPVITTLHFILRRRSEEASWSPRLRPTLAAGAGLFAVALQAALPFTGVGLRFVPFPELLFAGAAFAAQAFLAWRDASSER